MSTPTNPPAIFPALKAIMAEVGAIAKSRKTTEAGQYRFRSIDDFYLRLQPLLVEHGVIITPEVLEHARATVETKNGGRMAVTTLRVKFTFTAVTDGSTTCCTVCGEAQDSGDKSAAKAHSQAYKTAMTEVFCVPTSEDGQPPRDQGQGRRDEQSEETGEMMPFEDFAPFKAALHAAFIKRIFSPDAELVAVAKILKRFSVQNLTDLTAYQAKTVLNDVAAGYLDTAKGASAQTAGAR